MKRLGLILAALTFAPATARAASTEIVDISAPVLPKVFTCLYQYEGASYPTTLAEQEAAVTACSLDFAQLLVDCQPLYPGITLWQPGDPDLTKEQLSTNFDLVAQCSYEQYTAKPYWIPQFVDDVDICALHYGAEWRLITEADLASLDDADYQFFADTLTSTGSGMGSFYFSYDAFVRATDGTLRLGNLAPGVTTRISDLPPTVDGTPKSHLEGDIGVRCIRRQVVQ